MAFESLADKLQNVFKNLRGKGRLTEADVKAALKEVKMALLEADVSFKVVKQFISSVQERAIGQDVLESLTTGQMVIKIVNEELVKLMGSETTEIALKPQNEITVIMMIGLQGAGKTTTTAKLAGKFKAKGRKPLLAACDVYRPAAIKQLQVNGEKVGVPVFTMGDNQNPVNIAKAAVEHARKEGMNLVFLDTAGRLQIDESMMDELVNIKEAVEVDQTILVVDAMTGQDAVNVAGSFNDKIGVDGVILTKLDGDTRGGAALSIRHMTQKPIKFIGVGEKMNDFEIFHPDRMANRILGMGDVLSLIEKAQEAIDEKEAKELGQKMMENDFTYDDYLTAMEQMKKLGSLSKIIDMIPGVPKEMKEIDFDAGEKQLSRVKAIIYSMTAKERKNPKLIVGSSSRKKRIAMGSGTSLQEVNKLIKGHEMMRKQMRQMKSLTKKSKKGLFGKLPF